MIKTAIIIGAGPAGLTAAYELLKRTDIIPIILEKSGEIGGISRTINYKGNRMDMGPHRFFSKSDRVMDWWLKIIPLEENSGHDITISYQHKKRDIHQEKAVGTDPDKVMLVIRRLTRIYFLRKFFAYPIQLSLDTLRTLGLVRTVRILVSFLYIRFFPRKPENSLEDFIINKFGRELYLLFFKDYTEKVWGVPCHEISAEWGAQRIKGVSLSKAIAQALKSLRPGKRCASDIHQKATETSLIEQFLYPKHGPGSLWEEVARQVQEMGGKIHLNQDVKDICCHVGNIHSLQAENSQTGKTSTLEGDYFFSTMPVQELIAGMGDCVPPRVREVASGLQYRDFINVGVLLRQLSGKDGKPHELKDNWIYIQERDVKVGRLMIYNNWGGGMVQDPGTVWIGMEYFCNKTDDFWALDDSTIQARAIQELEKMDLARQEDVMDATVRRMEKTYPAYFGTYDRFEEIRAFTDRFENLFLVGRNGMHKYNNADHSMLTSMVAVDNIVTGITAKANLWAINTEQEYHEVKQGTPEAIGSPSELGKPENLSPEQPANPGLFFPDYLWREKWNHGYLLIAAAAFLLQFILFKFRYPYANYMPDSYSYLQAAANNMDVNMWPVAYSKFLRLISVFTHSDKIVVGIQYFLLQISSCALVFTLLYLLKPRKPVKYILCAFLLLNPVPLYVSNYISADALFIALSLLWLTTLIWILYKPRSWQIVVQAVLILACFTVRYNAIYYPLIAALAFLLSKQNWKPKLAGITLGAVLIAGSVLYTTNKMYTETGQRQFSAFGGWQLANNALYMYRDIPATQRRTVPQKFVALEKMVREHIDTLRKVKFTKEDTVNSYFYLWSVKGPLVQYMIKQWEKDSTTSYFRRWAAEGPLYQAYALYLIKNYPVHFAKSFLLPNAIKYAVPPDEFLGTYNMGQDSVGKIVKDWFNYKSMKVQEHHKINQRINATEWYPVFSALVNMLLIISLVGMLFFHGFRDKRNGLTTILILVVLLWGINMAFSVFASPIVLRYQIFPVLIIFCISVIAMDLVLQLANEAEAKTTIS